MYTLIIELTNKTIQKNYTNVERALYNAMEYAHYNIEDAMEVMKIQIIDAYDVVVFRAEC